MLVSRAAHLLPAFLWPFHDPPKLKPDAGPYPVVGFDTETLRGQVRLLCASDGRTLIDPSFDDLVKFLARKEYRSSLNFFYNIRYDFESIVKGMTPDQLAALRRQQRVKAGGFSLTMIPKKMFAVRAGKHLYSFYDLAQYFPGGLDDAAAEHLGERKIEGIDRALLGEEPEYWDEVGMDAVIAYCRRDAMLTCKLGELLQETWGRTTGLYPRRYVSKAGLSKQYFRRRVDIPSYQRVPYPVKELSLEAYSGGRFECLTKGNIGTATSIDINSAYPYEIAHLPDLGKGRWKRAQGEIHPEAALGFYRVVVSVPAGHAAPLWFRQRKPGLSYPVGRWAGVYTKRELEALRRSEYEVISGWEFFPKPLRFPFGEEIEKLHGLKERATGYERQLWKIVMNSLYGCFYEKRPHPDGRLRSGVLFNSVYAAEITAGTRVKVWREAQKYGRHVASISTDGLLIEGEVHYPETAPLGEFAVKKVGPVLILRSGIYRLGDEVFRRGIGQQETSGGRVIMTPDGPFQNIVAYIEAFPDRMEYVTTTSRPLHLAECLVRGRPDLINVFTVVKKRNRFNKEAGRLFERALDTATGGDLLRRRYTSEPLDWGDDSIDKKAIVEFMSMQKSSTRGRGPRSRCRRGVS